MSGPADAASDARSSERGFIAATDANADESKGDAPFDPGAELVLVILCRWWYMCG